MRSSAPCGKKDGKVADRPLAVGCRRSRSGSRARPRTSAAAASASRCSRRPRGTATSRRQQRELPRVGQQVHLPLPLARREAEVEVEHLQPPRAPGRRAHGDPRVLTAAALVEADRQVDVPLALDRPAAERRVAVAALAQRHVVADRPVLVAELPRDLAREVAARASAARPRRPPAAARCRGCRSR